MDRTILVADDEPEHLLTVESLLQERGYSIILASDGQEAVDKAIQASPDLIILDIMMPNMDGTEAAAILKSHSRTKDIPLFFMTAVIAPEELQSAEYASVVFPKPVRFSELLEAISKMLPR